MTRFLQEPDTAKNTATARANGMIVGRSSMQGWRDNMEDADLTAMHLEDAPEVSVFGIFDGHGGSIVSEAVSKHVLGAVMRTTEYIADKSPKSLSKAIYKGFLTTDSDLKRNQEIQQQADEVGSTGLVAMITPTHIVVGNVGDSRCVLSGQGKARALSIDHKPTDEMEKKRIIAAGGTVFRNRVCGGVAVSRSFGDYWFKRNQKLSATQQQVSAEPSVHLHTRQEDDEFLILACDGIWDVMSNEQAQTFVREKIQAGERNAGILCEKMLDECLSRGSRDNMSVILILFEGSRAITRKHKCAIQ